MARVPSKHSRDQQPVDRDLEGFLNNLQDWELGLKDKDKKLKSQTPGKEKLKFGIASEARKPMGKSTSVENSRVAGQYDYLKNYDNIGNFSSDESSVDANSEKELGNEYFKQKKFKEAVECYSRSIALSPTAVAYANRAMAYLKIKKFQEAEDDCTDALNLDDRYIKAYSRRSTARKELGKLKESLEDAEFALRLEPQNQEIKKQFTEAKSLLEKVILKRASGALEKAEKSKLENNKHIHDISSVSNGSQRTRIAEVREDSNKDAEGRVPAEMRMEVETSNINAEGHDPDSSPAHTNQTSGVQNAKKNGKQELKASVQELAARAATLAMAQAAKNIMPPNSAYQFEVSWRGLSGDPALQARLLKATSPTALPQIFKSALTAPLLMDIIRCIATFFTEEMGLAVKYLENLTRVQRFDMIMMCLSSTDKADLLKMWDEVFCRKVTPDCIEVLSRLRLKYCLKQ